MLLRAVMAPRQGEDQGVVALQVAELARNLRVVGQLVVGERRAGDDVGPHAGTSLGCLRQAWRLSRHGRSRSRCFPQPIRDRADALPTTQRPESRVILQAVAAVGAPAAAGA